MIGIAMDLALLRRSNASDYMKRFVLISNCLFINCAMICSIRKSRDVTSGKGRKKRRDAGRERRRRR